MQKKVCILHVGGTIGMVRTPDGYAPQAGYLQTVLAAIPELQNNAMPRATLIELSPLLDSTNVAVNEWNKIGSCIAEQYDRYDGFVVLHGTDTMAYTASALAFMLQNLEKPVVLTGSQIPFCEVRNDARDNLLTSLLIAARSDIHEVCLCFGGKLLRGVRSKKTSADDLLAFDSPSAHPLAECGIEIRTNAAFLLPAPCAPFRFLPFEHHRIAVLKVFPGIQFDLFENIVVDDLHGIVLEGFGAGNVPVSTTNGLLRILERARACGTAVVVVTQCLSGTARPGLYAVSAKLRDMELISGYDMTVEAAVTKLYALLSEGLRGAALKQRMETSVCGELTPNV